MRKLTDAVASQPERGVHAASTHKCLIASATKGAQVSVRMLKRRKRHAPFRRRDAGTSKASFSLTVFDEFHRVILRLVTHKFLRVADVPIPARVVGDAEENGKRQVAGDGFDQKLRQITRAAPLAMKLGLLAQERALIDRKST